MHANYNTLTQRALTHTLRDALDVYHQTRSETTVQIIRLEKLGLDPWQLILSFCAVFFGFIIYCISFRSIHYIYLILIKLIYGALRLYLPQLCHVFRNYEWHFDG